MVDHLAAFALLAVIFCLGFPLSRSCFCSRHVQFFPGPVLRSIVTFVLGFPGAVPSFTHFPICRRFARCTQCHTPIQKRQSPDQYKCQASTFFPKATQLNTSASLWLDIVARRTPLHTSAEPPVQFDLPLQLRIFLSAKEYPEAPVERTSTGYQKPSALNRTATTSLTQQAPRGNLYNRPYLQTGTRQCTLRNSDHYLFPTNGLLNTVTPTSIEQKSWWLLRHFIYTTST